MYSIISRDWAKLIPRAGSGDAPLATKAPGGAIYTIQGIIPSYYASGCLTPPYYPSTRPWPPRATPPRVCVPSTLPSRARSPPPRLSSPPRRTRRSTRTDRERGCRQPRRLVARVARARLLVCRSALPDAARRRRTTPSREHATGRRRTSSPVGRASDARLTRGRVASSESSPDPMSKLQTLTSGPSALQSRTFRPLAIPGTSLHAYLSLSTFGPSSLRRTYQPSARFSTSCVR